MTIQASITSRRIIAAKTMAVSFDTSNSPLNFRAGQYISVTIPGPESIDIRQRTHDFSIASSPLQQASLSIAFRLSNSWFKRQLVDLPLGSSVTLSGPKGVFTLSSSSQDSLVFIAGGIGIAPFMSMISFSAAAHLDYHLNLFYFNNNPASESYGEELRLLALQNKKFALHEIFAPYSQDLITENIPNIPQQIYYVAGPPGFVASARQSLMQLGVISPLIHTEEFTGYE